MTNKNKMITTEEYIKNLALTIEKYKVNFDGKYVLEVENLAKFKKVYQHLKKLMSNNGCKIVHCDITPKNIHGSLAVEISLLDLYKTKLDEFKRILDLVDVFGITPLVNNKIRLDFSVSYIWRAVPQK